MIGLKTSGLRKEGIVDGSVLESLFETQCREEMQEPLVCDDYAWGEINASIFPLLKVFLNQLAMILRKMWASTSLITIHLHFHLQSVLSIVLSVMCAYTCSSEDINMTGNESAHNEFSIVKFVQYIPKEHRCNGTMQHCTCLKEVHRKIWTS